MPEYKDIVYIDWTLVFTIVNTLILFFVLKHFLYDKVKKVLDDRKNEVSKIYDDANSANQNAQELKQTYEAQVATAREQAGEIVNNASARAQLKYDEILNDAQKKASSTLLRAQEQIEADQKRAVKDAKNEIADLAIGAAQRIIEKEIDPKTHEQLIEDFIKNGGNVKWQS